MHIFHDTNRDMDLSQEVYNFIKYSIYLGIAFGFLVLFIGSVIVHDTGYIQHHPRFFLSETLVMGILSSAPILFISYLRQGALVTTVLEFIVFFFKIAMIHVGFQLCGIYSILFPKSRTM